MRTIIYILLPPYAGIISLMAFTTPATATLWVALLGGFTIFAVRHYDNHHRAEQYDSKLSVEKWEKAIQKYVDDVNREDED